MRGLRDAIKRRIIFNYYRDRGNVICLQETHSDVQDEIVWSAEWGGDIIFNHGSTNARGVCILMPKGLKNNICNIYKDQCGRILRILMNIDEMEFAICCIYAPNNDSPNFYPRETKTHE